MSGTLNDAREIFAIMDNIRNSFDQSGKLDSARNSLCQSGKLQFVVILVARNSLARIL